MKKILSGVMAFFAIIAGVNAGIIEPVKTSKLPKSDTIAYLHSVDQKLHWRFQKNMAILMDGATGDITVYANETDPEYIAATQGKRLMDGTPQNNTIDGFYRVISASAESDLTHYGFYTKWIEGGKIKDQGHFAAKKTDAAMKEHPETIWANIPEDGTPALFEGIAVLGAVAGATVAGDRRTSICVLF